ncbi:MAG: Spy/CpxP family protein refolding chaperone [Polyangiaceae bacterium]|jgi:Spy/CpxP family protein refolding chaperone
MIELRWTFGLALAGAVACGSQTPQAAAPGGTAEAPPVTTTTAAAASSGAAQVAPAGATPPATSASSAAEVAPAGPTPTDEEDESMADLKEHHRHHHHGGFAMFIAMSLDSLGTTPEQEASIKKIQTDLYAKLQPAHDAEKAVLSALADGVAAGKIDRAKIEVAIGRVASAAAGVDDAVANSLNQLHAALTPPQRTALVGKVEAHFDVWREVNSTDEPAAKDAHGHIGRLTKELALTPDQVEKIRSNFQSSNRGGAVFDSKDAEAHLKSFADAFASDSFDAKSLTMGGPANGQVAAWGLTRMAHLYEAATPVLTHEQRVKLADSLRRHANYKRMPTST